MITARTAIMQGRDIYALPGNIDEGNARGTNQLIRDGANAILEAKDILENYNLLYGKSINYLGLTYAKERYIYDESVLEKMGVAARQHNGIYATVPKSEPSASELRPARRVAISEKEDQPSTKDKKEKKKKENEFDVAKKDTAEDVIAKLGEFEKEILSEIPLDRAISMDALCSLGYTVGEIMSALTLLEVKGLVMSLPGSLYIRK